MNSKALIALPFAMYVMIALVYNNAVAWAEACGTNWLCQSPSIRIFGPNADRFTSGFFGFFSATSGNTGNIWSLFGNPTISGWLGWASFLFGGLLFGISFLRYATFTSYGPAIGFTEQGSRFMMTLGILLLLWGTVVSWMGGWQEAMPYGLGYFYDLISIILFAWGGWQYSTGGG